MFGKNGSVSRWASVALLVAIASLTGACKQNMGFIDHVTFKPTDNLETVKVSLVFSNQIKTDLAGGFMIKDYGFLFINPYTQSEPFEIGFSLNTKIANDQDYVNVAPTEVLPNGMPIGLGYALVEVRAKDPISSKFDLYGYVDVLHASWLGTAAIFGFINDQYFPNGLSISQTFLRDAEGRPGVTAQVFGPSVSSDGSIKRAGGIALFANVRQLISGHGLGTQKELVLLPQGPAEISGRNAGYYQAHPKQLRRLEARFINAINQQ